MGICGCYIALETRGHRPRASHFDAGWSSPVARQAHNLKVVGSNPTPATKFTPPSLVLGGVHFITVAVHRLLHSQSTRIARQPNDTGSPSNAGTALRRS